MKPRLFQDPFDILFDAAGTGADPAFFAGNVAEIPGDVTAPKVSAAAASLGADDGAPAGLAAPDGGKADFTHIDVTFQPADTFSDDATPGDTRAEVSGNLTSGTGSPSTIMPVHVFAALPNALPANPVAAIIDAHFHDTGFGDGGPMPAPGYDAPLYAALTIAAPAQGASVPVIAAHDGAAPEPAATPSLAGAAHTSSGAITNAFVSSGGATAAQVQQALDEGGLSVNGAGIKVGVISDSFNDLGGAAADEADGALPSASNVDVIKDLASGGSDEGRAMMQIIHDIAPGASLAFYTAYESEQDFANGILALAAAGSKIIVDDVAYSDEPFFQNGVVAQAIQTVEAEGVTYVTAAGNEGSNGYQAAWTPISGSFDGYAITDAESFGGSLVQTITVNNDGTGVAIPLLMQWNQAFGAATSDLEILVFQNGALVGASTNRSIGEPTNPVVEYDFATSGTYQVAIVNLSGPNPGLIKEITEGDGFEAAISGANAGTVVGHAMTPGAITTGAVSVAETPAFGLSPAQSEFFSSSGAFTDLFFANNGTALSSPEALSPVAVSGVDDIATTVSGGLSDFYGTSAAAASLAGVAALMLAANPNLTPAQVEQIMEQTALPMSDPDVSGAGLVQVDAAVAAAQALGTKIVIESSGSTSLTEIGSEYYFYNSSGAGPSFKFNGSPFVTGEFGAWTLIGAEQTANGGYDLALKISGADQYTVFTTDSNGNFLSVLVGVVSGLSSALESLETTFHQDLNGDGTIGLVTKVVESTGSLNLVEAGNNFFFENSAGAGPEFQLAGAPVYAGEFGAWAPIAVAQIAGGDYDVALKVAGADQYTVFTTDSNGNFIYAPYGVVSGTSAALETLESAIFNRDLNGDGTIGVTTHVIEQSGSTFLTEVANNFFFYNSGGVGAEFKYGGTPFFAGEFGAWTLIGAEKISGGGYDVALKVPGGDQYTVYTTDSNGNYVSALFGVVSGSSTALESIETVFHQDLNGDGTIGVPAGTSSVASTAAASAAVPTQTSGASSASTGQTVSFAASGTSSAAEQIDLHDIDYNSVASTYQSSTGTLVVTDGSSATEFQFTGNYTQGSFTFTSDGSGGSILSVQAASAQPGVAPVQVAVNTVSTAGQDNFIFAPNFGQVTVSNFVPATDTIQISKALFANIDALLAATHDDAHGNAVITDAAHDTITIQNVTTAQLQAHASDFHFV